MTLKKETCIYISLFLSNPVERGFQGFPWRNELYTVSFCLEHSLAGDCHIWWVRKVRYSNHFKSLQNYQLRILMTHGSVSDMSLRKRDLYLVPENKQHVTLKLSKRDCYLFLFSIPWFIRQRCLLFSASPPLFLKICLISEKWNKTIHNCSWQVKDRSVTMEWV